jgi:hypothetical protein
LDGIPFTVDATNQIHCIEDFHRYVNEQTSFKILNFIDIRLSWFV